MDESDDTSRAWPPVTQHIALVGLLFALVSGFLIVGFRVLAVSQFDASTGLALISTAGAVPVTVGVAAQLYPLVFAVAAIAAAMLVGTAYYRDQPGTVATAVATFLTIGMLWFVDVWLGVALVSLFLIEAVRIHRMWSDRVKRPARAGGTRHGRPPPLPWVKGQTGPVWTVWLGLFFVTVWVLTPTLWLPAEVVAIGQSAGGEDLKVVGYVVDDSEPWMSILTDSERQILRFESDSVEQRTVCDTGSAPPFSRSLENYLFADADRVPLCADLIAGTE